MLEHETIAKEIVGYLDKCELAQDTFEGIVNWWLMETRISYRTDEVRAALSYLIDEGLLEPVLHPGQEAMFKLKKQ